MVQASEPWHRYHTRPGRRPLLDWPQVGSVLVQLIVNAILVMVPDVVVDDPSEMLFIQRDDVIEDFSAAAAYPPFRQSVLPRCLDARSLRLQSRRSQERDNFVVEFRVAVQNHVAVRASLRKGLAQLLDYPPRSRVAGHIAMQDLPAGVFDDEEAVEQLERQGRHREEANSDDHLAVVLEEGLPAFARVTVPIANPGIRMALFSAPTEVTHLCSVGVTQGQTRFNRVYGLGGVGVIIRAAGAPWQCDCPVQDTRWPRDLPTGKTIERAA